MQVSTAPKPERSAGRSSFRVALALATAALLHMAADAAAQIAPPSTLPPDVGNANIAASSAVFDLTSGFFQRLSRHGGDRSGRPNAETAAASNASGWYPALAYGSDSPGASPGVAPDNPLAAYAAAPTPSTPRFRSWAEAYGSRSHTDAQGSFAGDRRTTFGGLAGIGATLAPGINVGASVDQARSKVDVTGGAQSSRVDLTQIGLNVSFESGPWALGVGGIYGFGRIHSSRFDAVGESAASYVTRLSGALSELSYYWSSGHWRVVPKLVVDWAHVSVDSYTEAGGLTPVTASAASGERTRVSGVVEIGYTNSLDKSTLYDIGVYGKVIDILSQDVPSPTATPLNPAIPPRVIPGVSDARLEYAAGGTVSVRLASLTRIYAIYDGRFRSDFRSHAGTLGVEWRW